MCSCGCNTCETKAPLLTEGVLFEQPISENLLYHIKNRKPLTENTFRYGSTAFIDLWKEARTLYSRNILNVGEDDEHILLETHLGEYGMFEGERVPLDLPMLEEEEELEELTRTDQADLLKFGRSMRGRVPAQMYTWILSKIDNLKHQPGMTPERIKAIILKDYSNQLSEAEYQGKKVALGKPKRGGAKKFYVYVMNPKTKKVKKVSFGDTSGLSAKINNAKARKAFADRHDCKNKKDKTKAGYWSCRLPRYASLLGLKGSYSGYW